MFEVVIFAVGLFIGWNLQQPAWAKALQDKVWSYFPPSQE